jgi:hypothetical protein
MFSLAKRALLSRISQQVVLVLTEPFLYILEKPHFQLRPDNKNVVSKVPVRLREKPGGGPSNCLMQGVHVRRCALLRGKAVAKNRIGYAEQ